MLAAAADPLHAQSQVLASPVTFQQAIQHASTLTRPSRLQGTGGCPGSRRQSGPDVVSPASRLHPSDQPRNTEQRRRVAPARLSAPLPTISGPAADATSLSTIWGSAGGLLLSWEVFDFGLRGASVDLARVFVARANAGADLTRLARRTSAPSREARKWDSGYRPFPTRHFRG